MQVEKLVCFILLVITALVQCSVATAEESVNDLINSTDSFITGDEYVSGIPNLVGLWKTESVGSAISKTNKSGEYTHHHEGVSTLTGLVNISQQDGRVLHGTFNASRGKDEQLIGVIYFDNKHIWLTDMDGTLDLEMIDNNTMEMLYVQETVDDNVVAVGKWTRLGNQSSE